MLTARNDEEAAKSVGISLATLQRWKKQPEFEKALREAQLALFRQLMAKLHQASTAAVTTLLKIMVDPGAPLAVKARCAAYVIDQIRKGVEIENILPRIEQLERNAEASKQHGR